MVAFSHCPPPKPGKQKGPILMDLSSYVSTSVDQSIIDLVEDVVNDDDQENDQRDHSEESKDS